MRGTHLFPDFNISTLENGAPPVKFGILCHLLHTEFHGFNSKFNVLG